MTTIFYRLHVNHTAHLHTHTDTHIDSESSFFYLQNFHPIYSYAAIGTMSTANTNSINYTQFMLRYIQVHIDYFYYTFRIYFLQVYYESVNLETLNACIKSLVP